jgi:hypothetical protein
MNVFKFDCSGRRFIANHFIGIEQDADGDISIAQGFDGPVKVKSVPYQLSREERQELADYMISLWTKFKQ